MKQQNARKIGFFSALSITIGSMVGIGIFLKNASVGKNVDGNGITWLFTWIISGLIALLVAVHFGRISKIETQQKSAGLSAWTDYVANDKQKWFKKIVSFNYGFFYNTILAIALSFFTTELLVDFFKQINGNIKLDVWTYVLISFGFITLFVGINFFSYKFSGWISIATTVLKFIPLFIAIIVGIIFVNNHNLSGTVNGFNQSISFSRAFQGIMLSIPSVLFAFDSFVGIGVLSKQVKGGDKTVSKIIVLGMILVTTVYLLICLSSIFHYNAKEGTSILNVLLDSLPLNVRSGITIFVSFFLFISAFGTSNAIIGVGVKEFQHLCHNQKIFFSKKLFDKFGEKNGGLLLQIISIVFWALIIYIPSIVLNTDSIIDGFSNLAVAYFFLVYTYVIYLFWKNVYLKDSKFQEGSNKTRYSILVWTTIVFVIMGIFANFFFVAFDGIKNWNIASSWGLYLSGSGTKNFIVLILYGVGAFIFICIPLFNFYLIEKIEKRVIY